MTSGEKRLLALLSSSTLALLAACTFLVVRLRDSGQALDTDKALSNPAVRTEVVQALTRQAIAIWDSHNDPEVGRTMLPNLRDVEATGALNTTNTYGLRERQFELPKPPGTVRVVLLGDSFVQGFGVAESERAGVLLERYLAQHATGFGGRIECLHIGVGGWDVVSESAYVRRMLSALAPDVVLHVLVTNDLEDHPGVRGFGVLSSFAPLATGRTDALVRQSFPARYSTPDNENFLLEAADFESRHRYETLAAAVDRLATAVRRSGARYMAVAHWDNKCGRLWHFLQPYLPRDEYVALPARLYSDFDLVISEDDRHWSVAGHEALARLLFTVIRLRALLPELALAPWPEVEVPAVTELEASWKRATSKQQRRIFWPLRDTVSRLEPATLTAREWRQVYTGLDDQAQVSPFASFHLALQDQQFLVLRGRGLPRPELAGARVRASVEGKPVGEQELVPGQPFELRAPLPADIRREGGISVRLESSDYGYAGPDQQHCVSFLLDLLAVE